MWYHKKGVTKPGEETAHKRKPEDEAEKEDVTEQKTIQHKMEVRSRMAGILCSQENHVLH